MIAPEKDRVVEALSGEGSALAKYRRFFVGRDGLPALLRYEAAMMLAAGTHGALGYVLRKALYPGLFGAAGRGLNFGRDIALRCPDRMRLGDHVTIDDGCALDARGSSRSDGLVIGDRTLVARSAEIVVKNGYIRIGTDCTISSHCTLSAVAGIEIGDHAMIAGHCYIGGGRYRTVLGAGPMVEQGFEPTGPVVIGDDVWIGAGARILSGVRIGSGAVIGAGTVVREDVAENAIVASGGQRTGGYRRAASEGADTVAALLDGAAADPAIRALVLSELRLAEESVLDLPLDHTGVDSFDLMTLRTAVEARSGQIPDHEWWLIGTLGDVARLPSVAHRTPDGHAPSPAADRTRTPAPTADVPSRPPAEDTREVGPGRLRRRYAINMPHMALSGLGEPWVFKEAGDAHWAAITAFLECPSSAIVDAAGDRLYATFTRVRLTAEPHLRAFRENETLTLDTALERYGAAFYFATHHLVSASARCRAETMSTFSKYGETGNNTSLVKGTPDLPRHPSIPSLAEFPAFGTEYRTRRATPSTASIASVDYEMLPVHDINGVGLLYFAAYPSIFDLCLERLEGKGFLTAHSTVEKDVFYFANADPAETLRFDLRERVEEDDRIRFQASLSRSSDGKRMADILCTKARLDAAGPEAAAVDRRVSIDAG